MRQGAVGSFFGDTPYLPKAVLEARAGTQNQEVSCSTLAFYLHLSLLPCRELTKHPCYIFRYFRWFLKGPVYLWFGSGN